MKLAISSTGDTLESSVDQRFGRAKGFIVIDPQSMEYKFIENTQNLNLPGGAGIQSAQKIAEMEVDALLTGNCGPKAFSALSSAGIKVYLGVNGTIRECIARYNTGILTPAKSPNAESHWN